MPQLPEQRYHDTVLWGKEAPGRAIARLDWVDRNVLTGCINAAETVAWFNYRASDRPTPLSTVLFGLDLIWTCQPVKPDPELAKETGRAYHPGIENLLHSLMRLENAGLIEAQPGRTYYRLGATLHTLYMEYVQATQAAAETAIIEPIA